MNCQRKGTNDRIKLALALNEKPTAELETMLQVKDGRRFRFDAKTRKAVRYVLRVRGVNPVPVPAPKVELVHWVKVEDLTQRAVVSNFYTVDAHHVAEYVETTMSLQNRGDLQVTIRMLDSRSVPQTQTIWGSGR